LLIKKNNNKEDMLKQINEDKKLSLKLFDQINMLDPIEQTPVYLSELGVNSALHSLRQIMAEEEAAALKQERIKKPSNASRNIANINSESDIQHSSNRVNGMVKRNLTTSNIPDINLETFNTQDMASLLKLNYLYDKYSKFVDKKMIDLLFESNK
jgi:hypothetical protein